MQIRIDVKSSEAGWQVQVLDAETGQPFLDPATGAPLLEAARQLRSHGKKPRAFPLPPQAEVDKLPAEALHRGLCTATPANALSNDLLDIVGRQPGPKCVERFGRYLFATLVGDELWAKLKTLVSAKKDVLELALSWAETEDIALSRLPWEMMHGPDGLLAEDPWVMLTRRVVGTAEDVNELTSPPRVLFVVGTDLFTDEVIRPGAEYLGVLQSLQRSGLRLKTRLLLRASRLSLEEAVQEFRPTVVHFICHGVFDPHSGRPSLKLFVDKPEDPERVDADALLSLLRMGPNRQLPQIVVLNACSTASIEAATDDGQAASPLAAKLVRGGIPIVVGMGGWVADRACRLFTRRFYGALLTDGRVAYAAAEGRRAGIKNGSDPLTTVDWALPVLFLSSHAKEPRVSSQAIAVWQDAVQSFAQKSRGGFCDRLELFHRLDLLMSPSSKRQALAISVNQADSTSGPKYGRTSLLKEFAAKAVWDGHLPCLLTEDVWSKRPWPKTLQQLLEALKLATYATADRFGLKTWEWRFVPKLLELSPGDSFPAGLPDEIRRFYSRNDPAKPEVLAKAFCLELLDLLKTVRALLPPEERSHTRLLLLVDDLHKMEDAASSLLGPLFGVFGLGSAKADVRMVVTYASVAAQGQESAVKAIERTLGESSAWIQDVPLQRFQPPLEEKLAYQQFLLHWQQEDGRTRPLAVSPERRLSSHVEALFRILSKRVQGVPSALRNANDAVAVCLEFPDPVLIDADDEKVLSLLQQETGERAP